MIAAMNRAVVLTVAFYGCLSLAKQPSAPDAVPAPLRDLEFGDLNFLHTTDTHGWHGGHLQEPNYSADWGDYIDFSDRLREKLEYEGRDLLLIDTGDRVEGNGLYDSDNPKGLHTLRIFKEQDIDVICIGNHELYQKNSSETEFRVTVPAYPDSYIASNLDIYDPKTGELEAFAPRYRKFTTKIQGIRITAFGFIFDFTRNYKNTKITFVEEAIKQDWFKEAISDRDVDLFVVIGHAGAFSPEFDAVYKAIRAEHWDTPIQFFAGHEHRRAYKRFDQRSYGIASGRFLETIGFQSITGITGPNKTEPDLRFFRRYIDNNLYSFYHHTGLDASKFHSDRGRNVSRMIEQARKDLKLDTVFGCAPQTYWMARAPFPSKASLFTLLNETIFPEIVIDTERALKNRLILSNSGALRFDIFKGPFTIDTTYIISPFVSGFHYIKDVPYELADQVAEIINNRTRPVLGAAGEGEHGENIDPEFGHLAPPGQNHRYWNRAFREHEVEVRKSELARLNVGGAQAPFSIIGDDSDNDSDEPLTPGYVTTDDLGTDGDDTKHTPIPEFPVPNVISSLAKPPSHYNNKKHDEEMDTDNDSDSATSTSSTPKIVDLIFNEFLDPYVVGVLLTLGKNYTGQVEIYAGGVSMTDLISSWISLNWKDNCPKDLEQEDKPQETKYRVATDL